MRKGMTHMTTNDAPAGGGSTTGLLDMAGAASTVSRGGKQKGVPPTQFEFTLQLSFLLTIGYLTKDQAGVLSQWFDSSGALKLPDLPGPDTGPQPRMYELITTRIHFAPRPSATGPENIFEDIASAVSDFVGDVLDSVTGVLDAATTTLQAAASLVHEVHDLVVLAP